VANSAPVPQGASEVLSPKARTEALSSANHLRNKAANKPSQRASLSKSSSISPLFEAKLRDHPWVLIAVLMQFQRLRVLPELSAAKLELKHYPVPIASAVTQRTRHRPVLRFQGLRMLSLPLQMDL